MKRTTVALTDELASALDRESRRRAVSVSEITRQALTAHLGLDGSTRLPFANLGRSGTHDTASRMEELLAREWQP